jgi:AcrR family transcriptional regulator
MQKMRNTKEYLLTKAYEQYLLHGYASVSISVLQQELQIGRASLYYYFKDKDSLFATILENIFLIPLELALNAPSTITVSELIENRVQCIQQIAHYISNLKNPKIQLSNIGALILSGYIHIPAFKTRLLELGKLQFEQWETAIRNSIALGEIKPTCDITQAAFLFQNLKCGYEDPYSLNRGDNAELYRKSCNYLLNLFK